MTNRHAPIGTPLTLPPNNSRGYRNSPFVEYWKLYHIETQRPMRGVIGGDKFGLCYAEQYPYIFLVDATAEDWERFVWWANFRAHPEIPKYDFVHLYGDIQNTRNGLPQYVEFGGRTFLPVITPKELELKRAFGWCSHYWQHDVANLNPGLNPPPSRRLLPKKRPSSDLLKSMRVPLSLAT